VLVHSLLTSPPHSFQLQPKPRVRPYPENSTSQVSVAMTKVACLPVLAVCITLVYSRLIEVPFGSSSITSPPLNLLHRRDSAVNISNTTSTNDKHPTSIPDSIQVAGTGWDPHNIADDASWQKFKKKGNMFYCLMDMPDVVAGNKWPDPYKRTPPSASSPWKGTLQGKLSRQL
jgi:hypothetical protein